MGTISYTIPVVASTSFNTAAAEVDTALQTLLTWANGNVDGANVSATLTGRRLAAQAWFSCSNMTASTNWIANNGALVASGSNGPGAGPVFWALDPAGFAVTGKANTQLVLRMHVATNNVSPASTFSLGLYAATFSGSLGVTSVTLGAQSGSSATITPVGSNWTVVESGVFTFPGFGGYAPGVVVSGASQAANSLVTGIVQLFALNS